MSFYKNHLFFCLNERDDGGECCSTVAAPLFEYAKKQAKALDLHGGRGKARINRAGCLNRCDHGPVCVVYPSGTWYTFIDEADIDEILSEHLHHGREVKRLKIA